MSQFQREKDDEEYNAKMTLLSRNQKNTITSNNTNKRGSLSFVNEADFSKITPNMATSELKENSFVKGIKDNNSMLREELDKLKKSHEDLLKENAELNKGLDNELYKSKKLEDEINDLDRWRSRYLDLEIRYKYSLYK